MVRVPLRGLLCSGLPVPGACLHGCVVVPTALYERGACTSNQMMIKVLWTNPDGHGAQGCPVEDGARLNLTCVFFLGLLTTHCSVAVVD